MNWDEILQYKSMILRIAIKYSGNMDLAEDVAQEVMLKLFEDKKLDITKFNPKKKDAAIRNTIRNKTLKVLRSKKVGRFPLDSLDMMHENGYQVDQNGNIFSPLVRNDGRENQYDWNERHPVDDQESYE